MCLKGFKWSSLNAPGTHQTPLSHPILELEEYTPFSHYYRSSGVIRNGPQFESETVLFHLKSFTIPFTTSTVADFNAVVSIVRRNDDA